MIPTAGPGPDTGLMRTQAERDEKTIRIGLILGGLLACAVVFGLAVAVVGQIRYGWVALGVLVMVLGVARERWSRRRH